MQRPIARNSVHFNARYNVCALHAFACHSAAMDDGWFIRLFEALEGDARSYRQISADAGLGVNYVQQMVGNKKKPTIDKLFSILDTLGSDSSVYILTGVDITDDDIKFLKLLKSASQEQRESIEKLLRDLANPKSA